MRTKMAALAGVLGCLGFAGAGGAASLDGLRPAIYSPADSAANLTPVRVIKVHVYTCTARSRFAYGVWTTGVLAAAKRGALLQCAIRTPRGFLCLVTSCR